MAEQEHIYEIINVNLLKIDHDYQRNLMSRKVDSIVKKYNPKSIGVLVVSVRKDGTIVVLDGQHRLEALRRLGIKEAPCKVYMGLSKKEEAEIFLGFNTARANPMAIDRFRARLEALDPNALAIKGIVESHGHTINLSNTESNGIRAVSALDAIYLQGGKEALDDAITIINLAWPGEKDALQGLVIQGIHRFMKAYKAEDIFDKARLIRRLKLINVLDLLRKAHGYGKIFGGNSYTNVARAITEIYNYKLLSNRLTDKFSSYAKDEIATDIKPETKKEIAISDQSENILTN